MAVVSEKMSLFGFMMQEISLIKMCCEYLLGWGKNFMLGQKFKFMDVQKFKNRNSNLLNPKNDDMHNLLHK